MTIRRDILFWACLSAAVLASRLCQVNVLWADEDYHLAAAIQALHGKLPYRDFWYDKPPLNLLFYLLFGARTGVALRLVDALFVCLCCALAFRFAARLWSKSEGYAAAALLAFFSIFYLLPGILPEEPDTLLLAPHLAAVYLAWRKKPFLAGVVAGIGFQLNVKGIFVLACAALYGSPVNLFAGFLIPNVIVVLWLAVTGSLPDYWAQVWKWGWLYASGGSAVRSGLLSLLGWFGFHAALVLAAIRFWMRERSRTLPWFLLALLFTLIGLRPAPRYFNILLPPLIIAAAGGWALARAGLQPRSRAVQILCLAALTVPLIRFAPRYLRPTLQADTAMDRESRQAAETITSAAKPNDTIFIWGYRPNIVAYTRLSVGSQIWDSQPLTGVPADRHLSDSRAVDATWAAQNRQQLIRTQPTFLVDGLSQYNPRLAIRGYPDLADWLSHYCEIGHAAGIAVYRVCAD
jgi:4-amino-4-deoxy-L-arabinose transferase-like glycosyltransferase